MSNCRNQKQKAGISASGIDTKTMPAEKRLLRELQDIRDNPTPNVTAQPRDDSNIFEWIGVIDGPPDTPYEGGRFKLKIRFPKDYPFKPPLIKFVTRVYHPNIDADGNISLDTLAGQWSPALFISKVLLSILSLLSDPNPDDPLVPRVGQQYKEDRNEFVRMARKWTEMYADGDENQQMKVDDDEESASDQQQQVERGSVIEQQPNAASEFGPVHQSVLADPQQSDRSGGVRLEELMQRMQIDQPVDQAIASDNQSEESGMPIQSRTRKRTEGEEEEMNSVVDDDGKTEAKKKKEGEGLD